MKVSLRKSETNMNAAEAYEFISSRISTDVGRFYGDHAGLSIGVGIITKGIRIPFYNEERDVFRTISSTVFVLTHECDVSQENIRPFNDDILVCPLILFENFVNLYNEKFGEASLQSFLDNVAKRNVSRLMYFPPLGGVFEYGAIMFMNAISSTKIRAFQIPSARVAGALSEFGLREVDHVLENHLLRPKDQKLSFHS